MSNDYTTMMIGLWQSACQDKPSRSSAKVEARRFVLTINGNRSNWTAILKAAGVPDTATETIDGDTLAVRWLSVADAIFGTGGMMAQALPNYEVRLPQLHMARLVQRAIEMGQPAVIEAGTGTGKCLHPDTLITLADGTQKRIADLVGQTPEIVRFADELFASTGTVARCWSSGEKQTYELTTRLGREIKASKDHRFLTVTGWKRLEELSISDRIAVPRRLPTPEQSVSMPEHEVVFLAHMITDGTCSPSGPRGWAGYTKSDPALVEDIQLAVEPMGCKLVEIKQYHYGIRRQKLGRYRNPALVMLEKHGLAAKNSYGKFVPDAVFCLPQWQLALFLGRLFSGDGTVDAKRSVIEYSTVSRRLAEQVQHLLLRFGVVASLAIKNGRYNGERHVSWRLTVAGKPNVEAFYRQIGPGMVGAKAKRLQEAASRLESIEANPNYDVIPREIMPVVSESLVAVGWTNYQLRQERGIRILPRHKGISRRHMRTIATITGNPKLTALASSDVYWDEVVGITPAEVVETYDIEMVGNPNFVANGIVVHNSFSYAAVCMALNKKLLISTSNKALQMQLMGKDLPFLCTLFPNKKIAVSVGKGNYACRAKCDFPGDPGALIGDQALYNWYRQSPTGNTEEISFAPDYKALKAMTVDDECTGRHCAFYDTCHYYTARAALQEADVVVTNHALLCLDQVAEGHILPPADVVVVDEAHKLPDYMRSARGAEVTVPQVQKAIALADGYADIDSLNDAQDALWNLERAVNIHTARTKDPQVQIAKGTELDGAGTLTAQLLALAGDVWAEDELPGAPDEIKRARRAQRIRSMAAKITMLAGPTPSGYVRWIDQGRGDEPNKLCCQPFDVSSWIAQLAGVRAEAPQGWPDRTRCARCARTLTAARVAILDGLPYGPDCIEHVDLLGDAEAVNLADWLAETHDDAPALTYSARATVFCSATLAAPDMAHFMRQSGLPAALQMQTASPFDYATNALLYLPSAAAPAPSTPEWGAWAIAEMRNLVLASGGGAFLLFTSYTAMHSAVQELRGVLAARRLTMLVQGDMPKMEIARRFREDGNAVLFATKSFFEGVSIDGAALRLVVVDKMPFEAPSPLTQAMEAALLDQGRAAGMTGKTLEMHPFNALRVPRMITELKQALGRLIRTQTDTGVMAVLDSRVRSAMYGRNMVIPSLPPAQLVSRPEMVASFFGTLPKLPAKLTAPPAEVRAEKAKAAPRRQPAATVVDEAMPF